MEYLSAENLIHVSCKNINSFLSHCELWIVSVLSGKRCHKNLFNVEAIIRNNTEMPYVSGKHLVKKVKNGYSQEERINVSDKKNGKEGMPTSKRYFSAWKGLNLFRMKVLPSTWIHAQCNICCLVPWQDVMWKMAHLHTSTIMRLRDLCCFTS